MDDYAHSPLSMILIYTIVSILWLHFHSDLNSILILITLTRSSFQSDSYFYSILCRALLKKQLPSTRMYVIDNETLYLLSHVLNYYSLQEETEAVKRKGQDTPEYKAVHKNYCTLVTSFQDDFSGLVAKFFQEGLITTNENDAAKKVGASFESCSDLLDYIMMGIELDASKYDVFFSILQESELQQLKVVTEAVKKSFESLQQSTSSDSHGNDGEGMEGEGKGQDTSKYIIAIRANYHYLEKHFMTILPQVTAKSFEKGLIGMYKKSEISNLTLNKFDRASKLMDAILKRIEQNTKWYHMLISILQEFSELECTVPEIKKSLQTGEPSRVEAEGARIREKIGNIARLEVEGEKERAEMKNKINDLEAEGEIARRIIAEKEEEIKRLKESETEKRKKLEEEIQKQKGVIETHESMIDNLLGRIQNSEEKEKVSKLTEELALEKEYRKMDKKMSEMKEQFLNEREKQAINRENEAIEREKQAINRENEATQTAKEILGRCEDLESMVRAAKDEAMQVKKASDEHCSRCSKCDPCLIYTC